MMGPGFGEAVASALITQIALLIVAAFALGALAMWGLPILWDWLKPLIHQLTA